MIDEPNTIDNIGDDIAGRMLNALTRDDYVKSEDEPVDIPVGDQKKFLIKNISLLSIVDRKDIGEVLVRNNRKHAICECGEGSVINLDVQPDDIVTQMYKLIVYKLNRRK